MHQASQHGAATTESTHGRPRAWGAALVMAGLIAAFYRLREHWGHAAGARPNLLLPACPLMHLFQRHGGHGRHDSHGPRPGQE